MEPEVRKQVLDLLHSLNEGISYVEKSNHVACEIKVQVLNDCLACILPIENCIGDVEEDTRKAIVLLLGVLEKQIQKMRIALGNQKSLAMSAVVAKKQLFKIEEIVIKLRNKKEIVFLPYKASMWDALESIWRAASEDENCLTYVVPIPYCSRNSNGSVAAWHYEGHELPNYVPVTDWQQFDLAEHRPDVIYIHNAYDDHNWVTSIHPDYYSKELKKYTDMLVYVPYFVSGECIAPNSCQMMGIINADKVIVESDLIKSQYEANYPGGNPPEDKFLALGSPKFDKVKETNKDVFPLPEGWQSIIQGKKIILYITTLEPVLKNPESFIAKHQYVFSIFKGREDVALWWRPHPLLKETLESMRPEYVQAYTELEREYKEADWGIYDESADLHRAIVWSDAYYGDMSSVICLYKTTGKPMMMQNIDNDEEATPSFATYFVDGDTMWFTAFFFNGLFKMDMATKQISFVGKFPREDDQTWMYSKVMKVGHYLFFFPALATAVAVLNLETTKVKMYYLGDYEDEFSEGYRFFSAVLWGEWFYLLPLGGHVIVKMHVVSGEIQYESDWYEALRPYVKNEQGMLFSSVVQRGKYIWCPYCQANLIVRFDLETLEVKTYSVGKISNTYYNMNEGDSVFWLVTKEGDAVVRWNPETQETMEYRQLPAAFCKGEYALYWPIYHEGTVWVFPATGNRILKLNVETGEFSEHTDYPKNFVYEKGLNIIKYGAFENQNGIITAFPIKANMMLQIDATAGRTIGTELKWPEYHPTYFSRYLAEDCAGQKTMKPVYIYKENERFSSLKDYLDFVTGNKQTAEVSPEELFRKKMKKTSGNVGMNIYKKIKCLLNLVN